MTRLWIGATLALTITSNMALAEIFGGVDFPDGATSFVDAVVSYDPVIKSGEPTEPNRNPAEALGVPDYTSGPGKDFVSLGDGGSITLQFTDNSLTGSDDALDDLWIFEIGPAVENTFVEISKDGVLWSSVGEVGGATSGIDIDAFGFGTSDFFSHVRLTDNPDEGSQTGETVGADIDAVGAISSAPPVPEPSAFLLGAIGMLCIGWFGWRRRREAA